MKSGSWLIFAGLVILVVGVGVLVFRNSDKLLTAPYEPIPEPPTIPGCTEVGRVENGKSTSLPVPPACLGRFCKLFLLNLEYAFREPDKYVALPSKVVDFMQSGKYYTSTNSGGINGYPVNDYTKTKEKLIVGGEESSLLNDGAEYESDKFTLRSGVKKSSPNRAILYVC